MQITCIYCGAEVVITPDHHRCRHCSGDLSSQVTPDFKASYYYQKASESAEQGAVYIALQHIQKGLQAQNRPDLHLLAAILYADLGREEQLRMHIGAIPTDDILRGEAEALLKQLYERRQAEAAAISQNGKAAVASGPSESALWGPRLIATVVTAGALLTVMMFVQIPQQDWLTFGSLANVTERIGDQVSQWQARNATEPELDIAISVVTPEIALQPETQAGSTAPEAVVEATSLESPAPESAPVVLVTEEPPLLANQWQTQVTQDVLTMIAQERIDFTQVLLELGYSDLADTEVVAVVQGRQLVLMGTVPSLESRLALLNAAWQLRGVGEVDAHDVRVVVPEKIYVVQDGDSLWSIAQEMLGDGARWPEILAHNPEMSDSRLRPGQELRIPPVSLPNVATG